MIAVEENRHLLPLIFRIRSIRQLVPPAVAVLVNAIRCKIDLTVFDFPGAEIVGIEAIRFEVDLAIFYSPPAEAVLINTRCLEVDFASFNIIPTAGATEDAGLVDFVVGLIDNKIVAAVFEFLDRIVVFNDRASVGAGKDHSEQRQDDCQRQENSYKAFR